MNKLLLYCCFLPLKHLAITSGYGLRVHPITKQYQFHSGIDLQARHDTVYAICCGVASVGFNERLGLYMKINYGKLCCSYGHLSDVLISDPQVTTGEPVAITGATGRVTGEHLHLSISYYGRPLDPLKFLYQLTIKSNNHE